jgi:hypothetical protein
MARSSRRRRSSAEQWLDLAFAVPDVIARRVHGNDPRERTRMVTEKLFAAGESWNALAVYAFAFQRAMLREMLRHRTWSGAAAAIPLSTLVAFARQAERGLASAMAPYHRRATANARRLARSASRR